MIQTVAGEINTTKDGKMKISTGVRARGKEMFKNGYVSIPFVTNDKLKQALKSEDLEDIR